MPKLTDTAIKNLKPKDKAYTVPDSEYAGYVCRVFPSGVKSLSLRYRDRTGKRERETLGQWGDITAIDAREAVKDILAKARLGESSQANKRTARQEAQRPTFREYVEGEYSETIGTATRKRLLSVFGKTLGRHRLDTITVWQIEKWKAARLKAVKDNTVQRDMNDLHSLFVTAGSQYGIPSPMDEVKRIRLQKDDRVRYLEPDERKRLDKAVTERDEELKAGRVRGNLHRKLRGTELMPELPHYGDHIKPMAILSLNTGIRRGELFKLTWENVDLRQHRLTVRAHTAKSDRTRHIPLNTEALNTLRLWKKQQTDTTGLVFPSRDGRPFDTVKKAWAAVLEAAKIQGFRWHDMRHDFASQLVMSGVDLYTVSKLLGHASIEMTQRYAHLADATLKGAVEVLNG